MFASIPYHVVKAAHGLPSSLTSPTRSKRSKPIKGPADRQPRLKENPSLTGWSHGNSPNASGIVGETFRGNNVATSTNRATEANLQSPKEKPQENSREAVLPEEHKEILLDVTSTLETQTGEIMPENPREEKVQINAQRNREIIMRNLRAPVINKPATVVKTQKSADFNNSTQYNQTTTRTLEFPLSIPDSPGHNPHARDGMQSPISMKHQKQRTSYSKLLADPLRTTHDFKVFRMAKLKTDPSYSPEKRSATVVKTRSQQTLYIPTTVLNGSKLVKREDTTKQKNLRLSKALCLWSQGPSQINTSALGDSVGLKCTEPLSLESPGYKSFSQTPIGIITTKVYNFMGKQEGDSIDAKQLGPFPHFKPTMKVRRPIEDEKSEIEGTSPPSRYDMIRMRQTSPFALYNKDMESSNGFKGKSSRNMGQRSETRRRLTNDIFKEDTELLPQELNEEEKDEVDETQSGRKNMTQRVMERVAKIITKKRVGSKESISEVDQDDKKPKKPPKFLKIEAKIEVDGKKIKRGGKNVRIGSSSAELSKGIKDLLEIRTDAQKLSPIKNIKLTESKH